MSVLFNIITATSFISLISFIGALVLFLKENLLNKLLLILVAFSAGALIGGAFLHLIPEAITKIGLKEDAILSVFLYLIFGFCVFFVLENFVNWHHHHTKEHPEIKSFSYLILISDGIHNFIDGLLIAGAFVAGFPIGIVTALAVALHEIPQEIGDIGVLLHGGFKKARALFLNFLSGVLAVLGGIVGFLLSEQIEEFAVFLLPFAAGTFIYIACSDLIPEIKERTDPKKSLIQFLTFLAGIGFILIFRLLPLD